ncbi:MAG: sigma factor-like helix-turn-helix DNA-binding protein [Acidobacteriota bacterium]
MNRSYGTQQTSKMGQRGLYLVRKPLQQVQDLNVVREATSGRVIAVLPRVWAVASTGPEVVQDAVPELQPVPLAAQPNVAPKPEVAFYRKYTEAMLRRYLRLSMEAGRVPSLLGRELFRGNVTSYRVKSFEDVVIFCHDIEKCLDQLDPLELRLVKRIALQQYTQAETASALRMSYRDCKRKYYRALDRLTKIFLRLKLMDVIPGCQGGTRRS